MTRPVLPSERKELIFSVIQEAARRGDPCPSNADLMKLVGTRNRGVASRLIWELHNEGRFEVTTWGNTRQITFSDGTRTNYNRGVGKNLLRPGGTDHITLPTLTIKNTELHQRWHAAHEMAHATLEEEILAGDYD